MEAALPVLLQARNVMAKDRVDGDESFDRLFAAEYRRVVAIAFRILNDADAAEDVAQEVFVSFHGQHDPAASYAPAWLHRAASHLALNALRSRKRRAQREESEARMTTSGKQDGGMSMDPASEFETREVQENVRAVLRRLPARSASVLALRYSGLSYSEVAAALNCGINEVGTLLRRAEAAFRKELQNETH